MTDIVDEYGRPLRLGERRQNVPEPIQNKNPSLLNRAKEMIFGNGRKSDFQMEAERIYAQKKRQQTHQAAVRAVEMKLNKEKAIAMQRQIRRMETRPSRLFRDSDRDGVPNVFDCQPYNRRKQDKSYGDDDADDWLPTKEEMARFMKKKTEYERTGIKPGEKPAPAPMPAPVQKPVPVPMPVPMPAQRPQTLIPIRAEDMPTQFLSIQKQVIRKEPIQKEKEKRRERRLTQTQADKLAAALIAAQSAQPLARTTGSLYVSPKEAARYNKIIAQREKAEIERVTSGLSLKEQAAFEKAGAAYTQMKYVPEIAQPRMAAIARQLREPKTALTTQRGWTGYYTGRTIREPIYQTVRQKGKKGESKLIKKIVGYKEVPEFKKGIATRGAETMEAYGKRIGAIPQRFAGSFRGARRIEKKQLKEARAAAVGLAGMLFPMSGMTIRQKGYARGKAGRPAGVYKHVIPGVGPVHVYAWRRWMRDQKKKAQMAMTMREQAIAQKMMKRGLPPQMAYAQAERYNQMRQMQALEEAQQMPAEEFPPQYSQPPQRVQPQPQYQARGYSAPQARAPITQSRINPFQRPQVYQQGYSSQGYTEKYNIFNGQKVLIPKRDMTESWANSQSSWAGTPENSIFRRPVQIGLRKPLGGGYQ